MSLALHPSRVRSNEVLDGSTATERFFERPSCLRPKLLIRVIQHYRDNSFVWTAPLRNGHQGRHVVKDAMQTLADQPQALGRVDSIGLRNKGTPCRDSQVEAKLSKKSQLTFFT
jgi:hypothetical protein